MASQDKNMSNINAMKKRKTPFPLQKCILCRRLTEYATLFSLVINFLMECTDPCQWRMFQIYSKTQCPQCPQSLINIASKNWFPNIQIAPWLLHAVPQVMRVGNILITTVSRHIGPLLSTLQLNIRYQMKTCAAKVNRLQGTCYQN